VEFLGHGIGRVVLDAERARRDVEVHGPDAPACSFRTAGADATEHGAWVNRGRVASAGALRLRHHSGGRARRLPPDGAWDGSASMILMVPGGQAA